MTHAELPLVVSRRDAILAASARMESVRALTLFSGLVAAYTVLHFATEHPPNTMYAMVDALQVLCFASTALLLHRGVVPDRLVASVVMFAVGIGVAGQTFDYTIDGERWALLIAITMSGTVVLDWLPFAVGSLFNWLVPSVAFLQYDTQHAATWILGTLVAIAAAGTIVRSRRQSADELARAHHEIEQLATVDPMTALLNRRGFAEQSRLIRGAARRTNQPVFAVFVDVGGLKRMNDTYGHERGDALIRAVAAAVARNARETDLACRWGGDEFLIIGVGERPDALAVNDRLLSMLDTSGLPDGWQPVLWTGSAQSASLHEPLDAVIARADQDLYVNRGRSANASQR